MSLNLIRAGALLLHLVCLSAFSDSGGEVTDPPDGIKGKPCNNLALLASIKPEYDAILALFEQGQILSDEYEALPDLAAINLARSTLLLQLKGTSDAIVDRISSLRLRIEHFKNRTKGRVLTRMLIQVLHNIRTPVANAKGWLAVFEMVPFKSMEEFKGDSGWGAIHRAFRSGIAALKVLEPIFKGVKPKPENSVVDLRDILVGAEQLSRSLPKINILIRHPPHPILLMGSQVDLEYTLFNLCNNAYEAGARNVYIHVLEEGSSVLLRVRDDGPGIPLGVRPSIFDPTVRTTTKGDHRGVGIGFVADIIKNHHGEITFLSVTAEELSELRGASSPLLPEGEDKTGTIFYISLNTLPPK